MLTITRKRLLSNLSFDLENIQDEYNSFAQNYKNNKTTKSAYLHQLTYILKKTAIVKQTANRIPVKKGEVSNLIIASSADEFLQYIRDEIRGIDKLYVGKLNLTAKTNLKVYAEKFKKCLKEHDAELIINQ